MLTRGSQTPCMASLKRMWSGAGRRWGQRAPRSAGGAAERRWRSSPNDVELAVADESVLLARMAV